MSSSVSRRSLLAAFSLLSTGALLRAPLAHAECAAPVWHPKLLTPLTAPLPADTGFVVALEVGWNIPGPSVSTDVSRLVGQLRQGARTIPLTATWLAPGLARMSPRTRPAPGVWTLEVGAITARVTLNASALPAPPPVPAIRATTLTQRAGGRRSGGALLTTLSVELASPPAATWVALTGTWASAWTALPAPMSHGGVTAGAASIEVYTPPNTCAGALPGAAEPRAGLSAWFNVVDQYGQVSRGSPLTTLRASAAGTARTP